MYAKLTIPERLKDLRVLSILITILGLEIYPTNY